MIWELSEIDLESVCKEFQQKLLKGCIAGGLNVIKHWSPTKISRVSPVMSHKDRSTFFVSSLSLFLSITLSGRWCQVQHPKAFWSWLRKMFCRSQSSHVITFDFGAILRRCPILREATSDVWVPPTNFANQDPMFKIVKKYLKYWEDHWTKFTHGWFSSCRSHYQHGPKVRWPAAAGSVDSAKCRGDSGRRLAIADREAVPFQVWNGCNWGLSMDYPW